MGESGARRRIGDADEVLARRALNLPAGEMSLALQRLIAVGTVKLEFRCSHKLCLPKRNSRGNSMSILSDILFNAGMRLIQWVNESNHEMKPEPQREEAISYETNVSPSFDACGKNTGSWEPRKAPDRHSWIAINGIPPFPVPQWPH
jgi:hypothetical protein